MRIFPWKSIVVFDSSPWMHYKAQFENWRWFDDLKKKFKVCRFPYLYNYRKEFKPPNSLSLKLICTVTHQLLWSEELKIQYLLKCKEINLFMNMPQALPFPSFIYVLSIQMVFLYSCLCWLMSLTYSVLSFLGTVLVEMGLLEKPWKLFLYNGKWLCEKFIVNDL